MPTIVTSILRDGVTAAGIYPTLAAWLASVPTNLVTADQNHVLNVEAKAGGYIDVVFNTGGIVTDATRRITIQAAAGHRHAGVYDTAKALFKLPPATNYAWYFDTDYVTVDGIQIEHSGITTSVTSIILTSYVSVVNAITFKGCIFKGGASGDTGIQNFFLVQETIAQKSRLYLSSNLFQDISNSNYPTGVAAVAVKLVNGHVWAYNNTFVNCSRSFYGGDATSQFLLKNNLVAGHQTNAGRIDYDIAAASIATGSTNNASHDATAPGASPRINQTFTFVSISDFHLAAGDAGALGFGVDLSADAAFPISTDIDGQAFATPWPIGADQRISVTNTVVLTAPLDGRIYQRLSGVASIGVTGTYTGTLTAIQARVVQNGTNTPLTGFDWATVVATPTGNAYSFTLVNVPTGAGWYNVQVRDSVDFTITATGNKVGIGELIGCAGQSNMNRFFSAGASSVSDLVRGFGTGFTNWQVCSGLGPEACGNTLVTALNCPVGFVNTGVDGSPITEWSPASTGGTAGAYNAAMVIFNAVGGKLGSMLWVQGEVNWNGTGYASYLASLGNVFDAGFRAALGQSTLPVVIAALGAYPGTAGGDTTTYDQVKQAQYAYAANANNYIVDRIDCALDGTGLHLNQAGAQKLGYRFAQALKVRYGLATQYRGPGVAAVQRVSTTVYDVILTQRLGTDFTPLSAITGFTATDPGAGNAAMTISSAVHQSATAIRLTLSAAPVSLPVVAYAIGANPAMTSAARDNSTLLLPLEWNLGTTAALPFRCTLTLTTNGTTPAASQSGISWAWYDAAPPNLAVVPVATGTGATTNGSGVFDVGLSGSTLTAGQTGTLLALISDGTAGSATNKAFCAPVAVT